MLDVAGRPILEWILRHLASHGVRRVALNLHFMPDAIRDHFGAGQDLGIEITYSHEEELLGTAGAASALADFLSADDEFMLHYGDVVTDQDFGAMLDFHRAHTGVMTILVHERAVSNSVVEMAADGRVERFLERPDEAARQAVDSRLVFSGISICDRAALGSFPAGGPADLPGTSCRSSSPRARFTASASRGNGSRWTRRNASRSCARQSRDADRMSPAISVCVPNYNGADHLPRALAALLAQSHRPFEILVLDDGSSDGSLDLLAGYERDEPLVRVLRHERNKVPSRRSSPSSTRLGGPTSCSPPWTTRRARTCSSGRLRCSRCLRPPGSAVPSRGRWTSGVGTSASSLRR